MRIPFLSRRTRTVRPVDVSGVPAWVNAFRRWGLPMAAIIVLVLCAPGEQYLAHLAGWSHRLSWGMAGLFTLYAGLAAVIATQLPAGTRGKTSSIWGAVLSLGLAMGAQPVAHLFVTGWLTTEPKVPWILIVVVSSVPPLILGHLLHFAAMPPAVRPAGQDTDRTEKPVPRTEPGPDRGRTEEPVRPAAGQDTDRTEKPVRRTPAVRPLADKQNMSARALELVQDRTDEETLKKTLRTEFPDKDGNTARQADSIRKAISRAKKRVQDSAS